MWKKHTRCFIFPHFFPHVRKNQKYSINVISSSWLFFPIFYTISNNFTKVKNFRIDIAYDNIHFNTLFWQILCHEKSILLSFPQMSFFFVSFQHDISSPFRIFMENMGAFNHATSFVYFRNKDKIYENKKECATFLSTSVAK